MRTSLALLASKLLSYSRCQLLELPIARISSCLTVQEGIIEAPVRRYPVTEADREGNAGKERGRRVQSLK